MSDNNIPSHHGIKVENCNHSVESIKNETLRLLIERASCRSFEDKKIPDDILQLIFEAGIHSPTGGNLQPYSIIKIENDETKNKLAELCEQKFIASAPVNLLFCIDWHRIERWANIEIAPFSANKSFRHFWISFQDTIICAQNICTAVDALGLGSVYIGTIIEFLRELRDMFKLPKGVLPVVLLCIGYPKHKPSIRKKLSADVIVHNEVYHEMTDEEIVQAFNEKYPDYKIQITDEKLKTIYEVCCKVHNEEFANKCIEKIKEQTYINAVQRYFGLHYRADYMQSRNDEYLKIVEEFGFDWFKKIE